MQDHGKFDIGIHIDQQLRTIMIFPTGKDWTIEPADVLIGHLEEARATLGLVCKVQQKQKVTANNPRFQMIKTLVGMLDSEAMNILAQAALGDIRKIDHYIAQLKDR
jgi:hypothetical protein